MKAWLATKTCPATGVTRGQRSRYSPTDMNMANVLCGRKVTHRNMTCKKGSARTHAKLTCEEQFFPKCV